MLGLRKRRRLQLMAVSGAALLAAAVLAGYGFRDGLEYFQNPSQLLENVPEPGKTFRLGGVVEDGSVSRTPDGGVEFRITDGGASVLVRFNGILPDLFAEGRGAIARGRLDGKAFEAIEVLAKHDENYMPREVVKALKDQGVFRPVSE